MNLSLVLQGYNQSISYLRQYQASVVVNLARKVETNSKAAFTDLVNTSPVDTRAMQGGFRLISHGPLTKEIVNTVTRAGFSYPSAQATGTGAKGVPVIGMSTGFNPSWAGMVPNPQFRASWVRAATSPLALSPKLFG